MCILTINCPIDMSADFIPCTGLTIDGDFPLQNRREQKHEGDLT